MQGNFFEYIRMQKAKEDAYAVARFLKDTYGARVYGIGSLFDQAQSFSKTSDIDLVVIGVPKKRFFAICAEAQELTQFNIDIIPYLRALKRG